MFPIRVGFVLVASLGTTVSAQQRRFDQDSTLDNLVHAEGYETCELDTLGRITQVGTGSRDMILIAGAGFGGDIYDAFMNSRKDRYAMYAITLPGFGGTAAPPMPPLWPAWSVE